MITFVAFLLCAAGALWIVWGCLKPRDYGTSAIGFMLVLCGLVAL